MQDKHLEQFVAIMGGIRSLFLEEMEDTEMSPSKQQKFLTLFERASTSESLQTRKDAIIEMRKLFSVKKNSFDHFIWIAGIRETPPKVRDPRISKDVFNGMNTK